jgi:hypothetical protein
LWRSRPTPFVAGIQPARKLSGDKGPSPAMEDTPDNIPIDLVIHRPAGFVLAAMQRPTESAASAKMKGFVHGSHWPPTNYYVSLVQCPDPING